MKRLVTRERRGGVSRRAAARLLLGGGGCLALGGRPVWGEGAAASLSEADRGFAGLGAAAEGYAEVVPGRPLRFPRDHGQHPDYRIEWWYLTANLMDEAGRACGIQWTLFRQALAPGDDPATPGLGWRSPQLWMAHAAATDPETHVFAERVARGGVGQAGARAEPFAAWLDGWRLETRGAGFDQLRVEVAAPDFGYALDLDADGPLALQGRAGYSVKAPARGGGAPQASYYYSQPHFRARGRLELEGESRRVRGRAWLDREWSSQPLAPDQLGWDWFSLHLDSGDKLMAFRLRRRSGKPDLAGNWIDGAGRSTALAPGDLSIEPVAGSEDQHGAPLRWRLAVASRGLSVHCAPLNPNVWQGGRIRYFEGPIVVTGAASGVGYLEMTGYGLG